MENDANGASASGKRLGAAALGLLHSHIELFGIELQEQKGRTLSLLLFAGLALVFALLLLTALSGLLLVLLWDSYRLAGIIGLCVFYGLAALYCGLRLKAAVLSNPSLAASWDTVISSNVKCGVINMANYSDDGKGDRRQCAGT